MFERAIGPDGKQPLAAALEAGGDWNVRGRRSNVDQAPPETLRCIAELRDLPELRVHSTYDVEPRFKRIAQRRNPGLGNEAARIGNADYKRASAPVVRFRRRQLRQSEADPGARKCILADAQFGRPVTQPERSLRKARFNGVAEKQEVRARQLPHPRVRPVRCPRSFFHALRHLAIPYWRTLKDRPTVRGRMTDAARFPLRSPKNPRFTIPRASVRFRTKASRR